MAENVKSEKTTAARVWGIIRTVLFWIFMVAAVGIMIFTIVSVSTFDRNDRSIFGYKAFIVRSDSMKATDFAAGDLVLLKEVDPSTLKEGDIIAFQSIDPNNYGETYTHKIRRLTTDENGAPAFVTYGTTTNVDDSTVVTYDRVLGKYSTSIPKVGSFFTFLKTVPGYICCILLPFLALIVFQGINSISLFRKYKAEQMAEIEAKREKEKQELEDERKKLEEERAKSEQMMEELRKMQAQMSANLSAQQAAPAEEKSEEAETASESTEADQ